MEVEHTTVPTLVPQVFEVKKYVLPKFDVTVNAPQTYSVAVMGLKVESCAKYTYGQPVPGQALVEVCRDPFPYSLLHNLTRQCLTQTAKMNATGCASLTVDACNCVNLQWCPLQNNLLEGSNWPNKLLLNLTTNKNGRAAFSLNMANLKADLNLVASAKPEVLNGSKSPYFTADTRFVQLLLPVSPDNPLFSELTIVKLNQPLKCGASFPVTVDYSFVGEACSYSDDIIYMVSSKGVIVLHGFQTVKAQAGDAVTSGSVTFQLSVSVAMAPAVQILVYSVLPSENVVAASVPFDTDMCFQNQVSLQFSPATAVPAEGNVLMVSAQAGSLCSVSAVDQSVRIMEPGRRLSASISPCDRPSVRPSVRASVRQSVRATVRPSVRPCDRPSMRPSVRPSDRPSIRHKDLGAA
ncbi:pregnancy zone protein [Pimephales promelas]|nr:pregnancy zone protein [Pimephales promelas]